MRAASRADSPRSSLEAGPAVGQKPLLRQETTLVVHLLRALHPIAEIDVAQAEPARAGDMVENHEGADGAGEHVRIKERIDHGKPVTQKVGQGDAEQRTAAAAGGLAAIFDDAG